MPYSIAIDGPAGAGKSTVAKAVARELGYLYVDTGAMYRTVGLFMLRKGISLREEALVTEKLPDCHIRLSYNEEGLQQLFCNEENVTDLIRTPEISEAASVVSQYPRVREGLVRMQREIAAENSVVMDGRDIGTKVLPGANLKIYLTASVEVRARRRYLELLEKGEKVELPKIEEEVRMRDYRDMHRTESPLVQAEDAVLVDSSGLSLEETVDAILKLAL